MNTGPRPPVAVHESATLHVTGRAIYIDDVAPRAGEVHIATGATTIAAGRITALDLDAVRAAPGVLGVFSSLDVPGDADVGPVYRGDPLFASEEVDFLGQPLFAVAARSWREARQAAALAKVEYEARTPILDPETAWAEGSLVLPARDFVLGDADAALAAAPHAGAFTLRIGGQEHFYLEGQVALAWPTEEGVHVLTSSQHPGDVQRLVARVLALPDAAVIAETRRMGGGFGGKESQAAALASIAALVATRLNRPARYRMARREDFAQTGKRHPFVHRARFGFTDDGVLAGLRAEILGDCGCSADLSEGVVDRALFHADNAYSLGNAHLTGVPCRTNKVSATAFRGFGGPQGALLAERLMDDIAFRLDLDPLTVRRRNLYGVTGTLTPYGQEVTDELQERLLDRLVTTSDYAARRAAIAAFNARSPDRCRGIALTPVKFGISFTTTHLNQGGALVHVYTDGSVSVAHGGTEMGQGLYTKVRRVVARAFGIAETAVQCAATRTDKVANATPTAASAGADLNGMAAIDACERILEGLRAFAAEHHGVDADALRFEDGWVRAGDFAMTFAAFVKAAWLQRVPLWSSGFYRTPDIHFDKTTRKGHPFYYYAWGAAVSEVDIDRATGEYRVSRVDILHDVGRSLHPGIDLGQIEGGFIQGMGWLTTEDLAWNDDGRLVSDGPASYKIPTAGDLPEDFRVELFEEDNRVGNLLGSKAVGEPPLVLALSVVSALRAALHDLGGPGHVPDLDLPATPERVHGALQRALKASS
ncbi:MAG TPA: xanthine dehydrogenase molybdopterin binding subunit [Pseudomonadales bacterium]|nr:xanthine dehydrogenase molybdopterin binding subunit [Pseudomonadales bacterium]